MELKMSRTLIQNVRPWRSQIQNIYELVHIHELVHIPGCVSLRPNGSCLSHFLLMNLLIHLLIASRASLFYSIHSWMKLLAVCLVLQAGS